MTVSRDNGNFVALPDNIRCDRYIVDLGNVILSTLLGKTEQKGADEIDIEQLQIGWNRGGERPALTQFNNDDISDVKFLKESKGNTSIAFVFWAEDDKQLYNQICQDQLFINLYSQENEGKKIPNPTSENEEQKEKRKSRKLLYTIFLFI